MIGRVATKISNFFHDEDQLTKHSNQKRSLNSISPATPIKPNITINHIDHNTLVNTCHSLKKMKIDTSNQQNEEANHKLNSIVDNHVDEMSQIHSNEAYNASLISLSSSSSNDGSSLYNTRTLSDNEILEDQNISNIHENSTFFANTSTSMTPPMFVSVETQTVPKCTVDAFTQTTHDIYISVETHTVTSATSTEDVVTDEDIVKYLTKKRCKES
ncbi:unnamed protein product [Adineta steineri]|uniref:Uncharacterized protein n=1 Tax=Adineta steineri TaxID=433720 RepID=A0A819QEA4_9BILA|nr:unnamed protein product [Adineta steineri]